MRMNRGPERVSLASVIVIGLFAGLLFAGSQDPDIYTKKEITLKECARQDISGKTWVLPDPASKGTVLLFLASSCPIGNKLLPEIKRIRSDFSKQAVNFLIVYPGRDLPIEDAKQHLREFDVPIPALIDKDRFLTKSLGMTITPEAALVSPTGKLLYRGRVNDLFYAHGKQRTEAKSHDLRKALTDLLSGKLTSPRYSEAIGCYIEP